MSDWFTVVEGAALEQGDVFPAVRILRQLAGNTHIAGDSIEVEQIEVDLILMSQSCDLVEGREKIKEVVLCGVPLLGELRVQAGHVLNKKDNLGSLEKNSIAGLHALNAFRSDAIFRDFSVVQFAMIYTLPIEVVRETAVAAGKRLRLVPPYRELMAQRFGFFFSRIALSENLTLPR